MTEEESPQTDAPNVTNIKYLYDGNTLRTTLDQAAHQVVVEKLGYIENNKDSNIRIFIGFFSCAVACLAHFYPAPFPENVIVLGLCCVLYFICSGLLTYVYVEDDWFLSTIGPKGVWIGSQMERFSSTYMLMAKIGAKGTVHKLEKSVACYFHEGGNFAESVFKKDVEELVEKAKAKHSE